MALAGSLWVEGNDIHWLDSTATEQNLTFTDTGANPTGALTGSLWVEGDYLHYIDATGNERRQIGTLVGTPAGALVGSLWVEGQCLHYIDSSGEERKHCPAGCSGTIDCARLNLCTISGCSPECTTLTGCASSGEKHRVQWSHTGCDANCEISIHRSINGGAFAEIQDGLACCPADPDSGCCEFIKGGCADDCNAIYTHFECDSGSKTYAYKVRLETAGTDTEISSNTTSTKTGKDNTCGA